MDIRKFSSRYGPSAGPRLWSRGYTLTAAVLFALIALGLGARYFERKRAAEDLEEKLRRVNDAQATLAGPLAEAKRVQQRMQAIVDGAKGATLDEGAESWAPALGAIAASIETGVELVSITAAAEPAGARNWRLRLEGPLDGLAPRPPAGRRGGEVQGGALYRLPFFQAVPFRGPG